VHSVDRTWKRLRPHYSVWLLLFYVYPCSVFAEDEFPPVDCVISPYQIVDLAAAVPGVIEKVLVERSDFVKRGQVVAELAAGVERATVELAKARARVEPEIDVWRINLDFDEKRKARIRSLYEKHVTSDENKDDADREVELSALKLQQARDLKIIRKHELERAEEQLKQKTIQSPIDGFVLEKLKMPGEYVEDQAIVRIAQLDPLNVEAIVPIELYGKIPLGMAAEVHPETLAAETRTARVTVVDRTGDAGSGTFGVRLEMPNPSYELPAGLKCDLRFLEGSVATLPMPTPEYRFADRQVPQLDQQPADSEPDFPENQESDLIADDAADQETVIQDSAVQLGAAMPSELATDSETSESDIADSDIEYHPIRLDETAPESEESNTLFDADFDLAQSQVVTDIADDAPEDVVADAPEVVVEDIVADVAEVVVEDVTDDAAEDIAADITEVVVQDVAETAVEGVVADVAEDTVEEVVADVAQVVVEDVAEEPVHDVAADVVGVLERDVISPMDHGFRIGPILSESELTRIVDLLVDKAIRHRIRSDSREEVKDYIVLSPVISTTRAIRAQVDDMQQHGISDLLPMWDGDFEDRVSAGVYAKHRIAMLRKIRLSELGYETEVVARTKMIDFWWVDLIYRSDEIDKINEFQGRLGQHISMVAIDTQDQQ